MPPYIAYSLFTLFAFAIATIIFKITAKYSMPNPYAYYFWYMIIYFFLGLAIPLFVQPISIIPVSFDAIKYSMLYEIFIHLGIFLFALALFKIDITVMPAIGNLGTIITPVVAYFLIGENMPVSNIPWLLLIFSAGFFGVYNEKLKLKSFLDKNLLYLLGFTACLSLTRIFANKGIAFAGYWNFSFYNFAYGIVIPILLLPFLLKKLKTSLKSILFLTMGIIFEFFGLLAAFKAFSYRVTLPTIIMTIPLASVIVFIISRFSPRFLENHPLKTYAIRFGAVGIMTFGIIILALHG